MITSMEKKKFNLWVTPPKPSKTQMRLYEEMVRQCRNVYEIYEGPAHEYRCDYIPKRDAFERRSYWIDIALFLNGYKFAIEVNGPWKKKVDDKRKERLKAMGWVIIDVPVRYIDKDVKRTASYILDYITKVAHHKIIG